jgi:archaeosine synthase
MLTPERGMLSLTLEGGEILLEKDVHVVHMGDFDLEGNLFAVGGHRSGRSIRAGDEAVIVRKGAVEGWGWRPCQGGRWSTALGERR